MELDQLSAALEAVVLAQVAQDDASHDIHHARRVKGMALDIAARQGQGDPLVLVAAAYLHDLVNLPKSSPQRAQASTLSAEAAGPILRSIGLDDDVCRQIQHAIAAHSFSAGIKPQTIEAQTLQDADRLEALGAIGLARVFYIAGKLDSQLFDGQDPFAARRQLDDRRYAIDHFAAKLLVLGDTMQTEGGRMLAAERTAFLREFLRTLSEELGTHCPW